MQVTMPGPGAMWPLAFQIVVVTFASYLVWFWLLRHYPATRLSAFTLLTPVFGLLADPTRPLPVQAGGLRDAADKLVYDSGAFAAVDEAGKPLWQFQTSVNWKA